MSEKIDTAFQELASRDSVVGVVTGYGLHGPDTGVRIAVGSGFFSLPRRGSFWSSAEDISLGAKRPRREAEYSSPTRTEVKNTWRYLNSLAFTSSWHSA
jgi:hypothetical protein